MNGPGVITMEPSSQVPLADGFVGVLLELAPDAIAVTDTIGRVVHANGCFGELFGYSRDELLGRPVEVLLPEDARPRHLDHRRRFDRLPDARPMGSGRELAALHADGTTFPVEVGLSPVTTVEGLLTVVAVRRVGQPPPVSPRRSTGDQAVIAERDRLTHALNDAVIQKIFSAGLRLHGLLEEANVRQLAVLNPVINELDDAIRELRIAVFDPHRYNPDIPAS